MAEKLKLDNNSGKVADHIFVFLEIFAREGGIQSYVKDIFRAYLGLNAAGLTQLAQAIAKI